jgi:hypothetical protein
MATLTMDAIRKMARAKEMPLGTTEAPFEGLEYKADSEDEMSIVGAFIHMEGFRSIYLPFTNGEVNYQLDYLLEQLGCESYDPDEIAKSAGTVVKVSRYLKETEKKLNKTEYKALKKKYDNVLPVYMEVTEEADGTATVKNTFTNTNFNLKTIKE